MSLRRRLNDLEARAPCVGCPACRDRAGRIVWLTRRVLPDGAVIPAESEPAPCPQCGRVPEQIIEVTETVVEGRDGIGRASLGAEGARIEYPQRATAAQRSNGRPDGRHLPFAPL